MTVEGDALKRIESLGLPWYVTGSWALAAYAEPRMTRIDIVLEGERLDAIVSRLETEWKAGTWTGLVRPAEA